MTASEHNALTALRRAIDEGLGEAETLSVLGMGDGKELRILRGRLLAACDALLGPPDAPKSAARCSHPPGKSKRATGRTQKKE